MKHTHVQRGFTLFIAMILTSVILAVGLALLDVSYKQIILTSVARQSVLAFYNADGALECALLQDSLDTFDYAAAENTGSFSCQGSTVSWRMPLGDGGDRLATFTIPCQGGGSNADVTVVKQSGGNTQIYANGYSSCNSSDPNRDERGIEAKY